jgi:hypothetical protein
VEEENRIDKYVFKREDNERGDLSLLNFSIHATIRLGKFVKALGIDTTDF